MTSETVVKHDLSDAMHHALGVLHRLEMLWSKYCSLSLEELSALKNWDTQKVVELTGIKRDLMPQIEETQKSRRQALTGLWISSGLRLERVPDNLLDFFALWTDAVYSPELTQIFEESEELASTGLKLRGQFERLMALEMTIGQMQEQLERQLKLSLGWVQSCLDDMTAPDKSGGLYTRYGKGRSQTRSIMNKRA